MRPAGASAINQQVPAAIFSLSSEPGREAGGAVKFVVKINKLCLFSDLPRSNHRCSRHECLRRQFQAFSLQSSVRTAYYRDEVGGGRPSGEEVRRTAMLRVASWLCHARDFYGKKVASPLSPKF